MNTGKVRVPLAPKRKSAYPVYRVQSAAQPVSEIRYDNESESDGPVSGFQIFLLVLVFLALGVAVTFLAITLHQWSERDQLDAAVSAALTTPSPTTS